MLNARTQRQFQAKTMLPQIGRQRAVATGTVDVLIWGQHVGTVALDLKYGFYAFAYTPRIKASHLELGPLKMRLGAKTFSYSWSLARCHPRGR